MAELTQIYNYLPLSESLLTSGQPTKEQFATLAEAGVRAVINLALPTSSNALADEAEIVRRLGMQHFHIPVLWDAPSEEALTQFMDTLDGLGEQKVLVHCAANMRASAFIALYRVLRQGWKKEAAFEYARRVWDPFDDPNWGKFINKMLKGRK